ncbi:hypothetical protein ES703_87200 [subsurface metagenome]
MAGLDASDRILEKFLSKMDKLDNLDKLASIDTTMSDVKNHLLLLDERYKHFRDLLILNLAVLGSLLGGILIAIIFA